MSGHHEDDLHPESWPVAAANPGYAGDTGEFTHLSEDDVRGLTFIGMLPYQVADKNPEAPLFVGPYEDRLEKVISRYPDRMAALLPALHMAQEIRGFLSPATLDEVAAKLHLSPAYVRGVATFYTMYNLAPVGKYLIQVCTNISCNLCGGDAVLAAFLQHTGAEVGETSANGLWTVIEVECLGACGFPTAVQINDRYFENVRPEDVPSILAQLT
jgi:NADH-quinone oxidoreductase E subunit